MTAPRQQTEIPERVDVVIEVPKGSFLKRRADGSVDFVSPLPCPFNYGFIPGRSGGDGDPLDALVLGPTLRRGARVRIPVRAVVRFTDAGRRDDKWICSVRPLDARQRRRLARFFRLYALCKGALNRARGLGGPTRSGELVLRPPAPDRA